MGRKPQQKPYTLHKWKGRSIAVSFAYMPGKYISTGTDDEIEAIRFAEKFMADDGILADSGTTPTFAEFAKDFFMRTDSLSFRAWSEAYEVSERDEQYYRLRQGQLDNYVIPAFGKTLVTAITRIQIESWLVTLQGKYLKHRLAGDTRNRILWCLRQVLDDAVRHGLIQSNPADSVRGIQINAKERRALTREEEIALFPDDPDERARVWGSDMWTLYFSVAYDTGFRPGEVAALRVCDIYQTPHGLAVSAMQTVNSPTRTIRQRVKTTGKGLERRVGLLYEDTEQLLKIYVDRYGLKDEELLFMVDRVRGRLINTTTSQKHFEGAYKRAMGIPIPPGLVQYCIRHTYSTTRRGEMSDEILAISMGHTRLRDDYDHRNANTMIRQLDSARESFFDNRKRREEEPQIIPFRKTSG